MTREKRTRAIDAEWAPLEGEHDPAAYSRRCRRLRNAKRHSRIMYVQRLLIVGVPVLVAAAAVALAVR